LTKRIRQGESNVVRTAVGSFVVGAAAKEVGTSWSSLIFGVVRNREQEARAIFYTVMHVNKKIVMIGDE
jgi:hypothetical protein